MSRTAALTTLIAAAFSSPARYGDVTPLPLPPFPASFTTLPYVTVRMLTGTEYENLEGPTGLSRTHVQIDVWHADKELAETLRDDIRDYLLSFTGAASALTVAAVNHSVDAEFHDGLRDIHQLITRVFIWWSS